MADATQVRAHLIDWADQVFQAATKSLAEDLRAAAPVGTGPTSGETRDSVTLIPESSPPVFAARALSPTPQGEWAENGTPAHTILPHGNALVFEVGGQTVFAKIVHHPGTAAKPWFHPTLDNGYLPALQEAAAMYA